MSQKEQIELIKSLIRDVPDFPKPGIVFKDITPVLQDHAAFKTCVELCAINFRHKNIDRVIGVESRGFLFGGPVALDLGCNFGIVRKKGKLPWKTVERTYDLEYGTATLEAHVDTVEPGERVLVLDDLLATGGTARATVELMRELKAEVVGTAFLVELGFLKGRAVLEDMGVEVYSPIIY